jgi:hypothetical protein
MDFIFIWLIAICLLLGGGSWNSARTYVRDTLILKNIDFKKGYISETERKEITTRLESERIIKQRKSLKGLLLALTVIISIGLLTRYQDAVDHCSQIFTPRFPEYITGDDIKLRKKYDTVSECISDYPYIVYSERSDIEY